MSFQSITAAQRLEVRDSAVQVSTLTQKFAQDGKAPSTAEAALIAPALNAMAAALTVAGVTGLPTTSAIVVNASTVPVQNSAGAAIGTGTVTVAASAVTNVKLPATVAGVSNAGVVTVPITFVTARTAGATATVAATVTVANGVITAISIA